MRLYEKSVELCDGSLKVLNFVFLKPHVYIFEIANERRSMGEDQKRERGFRMLVSIAKRMESPVKMPSERIQKTSQDFSGETAAFWFFEQLVHAVDVCEDV